MPRHVAENVGECLQLENSGAYKLSILSFWTQCVNCSV